MQLRSINISCACVQALLCTLSIIWLILQWKKPSTISNLEVSTEAVVCTLIVFTSITCLFHSLYASGRFDYMKRVQNGRNTLRWLEYSITATMMMWIISVCSGVKGICLPTLSALGAFLCMLCGFLSDFLPKKHERLITAFGWIFIIASFSIVISQFSKISSTAPGFIWCIVVILTLLYMSFGVVHLVHVVKGKESMKTNINMEITYTSASVFAKSALVLLLLGGLVARQ